MSWFDSAYTISATLDNATVSGYTITWTDEALEAFNNASIYWNYERDGVYTISGSSGTFDLKKIVGNYLFWYNQNNIYPLYYIMYSFYIEGTPLIKISVEGSTDSISGTANFNLLVNPGDSSSDFISAS